MTRPETNDPFASCEQEELRYTASIQSHGVLVAIDAAQIIVAFSENVTRLGFDPRSLLKKRFISIFQNLQDFEYILKNAFMLVPTLLGTWRRGDEVWTATVIVHAEGAFVEFEPNPPSLRPLILPRDPSHAHSGDQPRNLESAYAELLRSLKRIINFDHIMVYQFLEDFSGEVVTEFQGGQGPRYLGHRFPASDIPRNARDLYAKTLCRLVGRSDETPVRILSDPGHTLDLTHSYLRSVSPVHLEYLRNMGVTSSLSLPIMADDRLWGLIACHNYTHLVPSFQQRMLAIESVQNFSITLRTIQILEENHWRTKADEVFTDLARHIHWKSDGLQIANPARDKLLSFLNLCGLTFIVNGRIASIGRCPQESIIASFMGTRASHKNMALFSSERCSDDFSELSDWPAAIGGLLLAQTEYSDEASRWTYSIIGYKPEVTQFISWAGKPDKLVIIEDEVPRMHPRQSFATWVEERRGCSDRWTSLDRFQIKKTLAWLIEMVSA